MRVLFFDQIKALMIALVISVHVFLALLGDWLGVHIAMSSSPHPLFVGVAVWVMSFSNTFLCILFLLSGSHCKIASCDLACPLWAECC